MIFFVLVIIIFLKIFELSRKMLLFANIKIIKISSQRLLLYLEKLKIIKIYVFS